MRSIALVALIAFLAVSAHVVLAQDCKSEKCTKTISVTQHFNNTNCQGNSTLKIEKNYTETCVIAGTGSNSLATSYECSPETGFLQMGAYGVDTCSGTKAYKISESIGNCRQTSANTSQILWCNNGTITDRFIPVKAPTNAKILQVASTCNISTGCTGGTGTLASYSLAGCAQSSLVSMTPPSALYGINLPLYECFTTNATMTTNFDSRRNVMATCSGGNYKITYSTGGCGVSANVITSTSFPTDTCIQNGANQWIYITCPSAASTLVASAPLALIVFLVAFLLM